MRQISAVPLHIFRLFFSLCLALEFIRHLYYNRAHAWYADTPFHYRWEYPFNLLPLPTTTLTYQIHFVLTIIVSLCFATGRHHRFVGTLLFGLYGWCFSWDKSYYNNHYYLILLFIFELTAVGTNTKRRFIPQWHLLLLRYQLSIVYIYGGIAKLNDDWMNGWPVRKWMTTAFNDAMNDVFSELNVDARSTLNQEWGLQLQLIPEGCTWFLVYGGLFFDLLIVPMMVWSKRSRRVGVVLIFAFHSINACLFSIGIFPVIGICSTVLFYDDAEELPLWMVSLVKEKEDEENEEDSSEQRHGQSIIERRTLCCLILFAVVQLGLPLRHFIYHMGTDGQVVGWTGNGELFAWRMMLTSKECTGYFVVQYRNRQGEEEKEEVYVETLGLSQKQEWRAFQHSDYTVQLARYVASTFQMQEEGGEKETSTRLTVVHSVYVFAECELNGNHMKQKCMNSSINLLDGNISSMKRKLWLPMRP